MWVADLTKVRQAKQTVVNELGLALDPPIFHQDGEGGRKKGLKEMRDDIIDQASRRRAGRGH